MFGLQGEVHIRAEEASLQVRLPSLNHPDATHLSDDVGKSFATNAVVTNVLCPSVESTSPYAYVTVAPRS